MSTDPEALDVVRLRLDHSLRQLSVFESQAREARARAQRAERAVSEAFTAAQRLRMALQALEGNRVDAGEANSANVRRQRELASEVGRHDQ